MTPHPQPQQHRWFCCEDCNHDEQGSCPVPENVINNISDLKKFQSIVKVTGCKHQQSSRPHTPQSERDKMLTKLHNWFNNYCEGNEDPDLWMAFLHAERSFRQSKDGE